MIQAHAEQRRRKVDELLQQGLDYKLLRGGSREAMRLLKTARELSLQPVPLPWPWPQLAAYRLAYVMMRDATCEGEVRAVLDLLNATAGGRSWPDPLQHGFFCAVLLRLQAYADKKERRALQGRIEQELASMARAERSNGIAFGPVQTEILNIAEILTFASGAVYEVEGLGRLPTSHMPSRVEDAFVLVGSYGVDYGVSMTEPFARGEFETRSLEADIAFEWIEHPRVTKPSGVKLPQDLLRSLPDICRGQRLGESAALNTFDVMMNRSRKAVAKLLLDSRQMEIEPIEVIRHVAPQTFALHAELRVIGLVSSARWPSAGAL